MTLPLKPLPVAQAPLDFELSGSPYIGKGYWTEGLDLFQRSLLALVGHETAFPNFAVAQHLDVHRCIADVWINALVSTKRAYYRPKRMSDLLLECDEISCVVIRPVPLTRKIILKVSRDLREYDPWVDRSLDDEIPDAIFADTIVDKYFEVCVDEHYIFYRKRRKRADGKFFQPVRELPRYASPQTIRAYQASPPDIDWRKVIDKAASDEEDC